MKRTIEEVNREYVRQFGGAYTLVLGEGDAQARLMLVGEAPGGQEEAQGRPFVGQAGKNLDAFLQGVQLPREALYITNAVKFRPTKAGKSGRLSNRTPTGQEVALFRPWLLEEIGAVRPRVIATLGNTPLRAITGEMRTIGEVHGRPVAFGEGVVLFPLYHPAAVIYRRELQAVYEADVAALADWLAAQGA